MLPYAFHNALIAAPLALASGSCEWNLEEGTATWSPEVFGIFGLDPQATQPSIDLLRAHKHPDDPPATSATCLSPIVDNVRNFYYSTRIFRSDGHVRTISATGRAQCNLEGTPRSLSAVITAVDDWQPPLSRKDIANASDGTLMLGLRARLPQAHAEIFSRYSGLVARTANEVIRSVSYAEDVVQDVFEKLMRTPEQFDARRGSLASFLVMNARSRSRDLIRSLENRRRRETRNETAIHASAAEDDAMLRLSSQSVRAILSDLPDVEREALELAFLKGFTYKTVGETLHIAEGTAKGRIRRGLRRLALRLDIEAIAARSELLTQ